MREFNPIGEAGASLDGYPGSSVTVFGEACMYFEKNLEALRKAHPAHEYLAKLLLETEPSTEPELYGTEDGNYTLKYRGIYLHDVKAPIEEAKNAVESSNDHGTPTSDRVHLILGIGLGYLLDAAFHNVKGKVVVYEPDLPFFRFIMENVDLTKYLNSGRVMMAADQPSLLPNLRRMVTRSDQLSVIALRSNAFLMSKEIAPLTEKLMTLVTDRLRDYRTASYFHYQWLEQFFINYRHFARWPFMDMLGDRFKDKPALIISRGPSLDAALPHIKELADQCLLIAVGGALRSLHAAGIVPDFSIYYDARGMSQQLYGLPSEYLEQITFVPGIFTQPVCFEVPSRGKLLFLGNNNSQYADWIEQTLGKKLGRLDGGSSVSLIGFQMATAMQCNPIILVGQDSAFPNNKIYAGGMELTTNDKGRLVLETTESVQGGQHEMCEVKGQQGEMLKSIKPYKAIVRHFEELAESLKRNNVQVDLYNTSLGGAHIEGYTLKPLSEFVGCFESWKNPYALVEPPCLDPAEASLRQENLFRGLIETERQISRTLALIEDLRKNQRNEKRHGRLAEAISKNSKAFYNALSDYPLVGYALLFETLDHKDRVTKAQQAENKIEKIHESCELLYNRSEAVLKEKMLPWVRQAQRAMTDVAENSPTGEFCSA